MDIKRAKEIISALAEGIDPTTGELLPEESVCNKGEVVRAFYAILHDHGDKNNGRKARKKEPEDYDVVLYERLKLLRNKVSAEKRKTAFMIFTNATLKYLSMQKPITLEDFRKIHGIGDCKARQYSEIFIAEIKEYLENEKCH